MDLLEWREKGLGDAKATMLTDTTKMFADFFSFS